MGGIDICIMAARAQETFRDTIPLMNKNGAVYPETYFTEGEFLKRMREKKILRAGAFAYVMDELIRLST